MKLRYVGMLAAGAVAGLLSGILWLIPNGLMGGLLGFSLALGAIWLGVRQQQQGGTLKRGQVILAGLLSGLLGGLMMAGVVLACSGMKHPDEGFGPPILPFWAPLVMGTLYGVVVHWAYAARLRARHRFWVALGWTCLGCFVLKTLATAFYVLVIQHNEQLPGALAGSAALALFGAVPFAWLWLWAMERSDPAW